MGNKLAILMAVYNGEDFLKEQKTAPEKPRLLFVLLESFLLNHAVPQIP